LCHLNHLAVKVKKISFMIYRMTVSSHGVNNMTNR
jgi:hypothetical protein